MSVSSKARLLRKLQDKAYRDAFVNERVKTLVPIQINTLRKQKRKSQKELAKLANTKQSAISRAENPNYGNLSINTLLDIAHGLDVGLLIKFAPFTRLLTEFEDLAPEALFVKDFESEEKELDAWSLTENVVPPSPQAENSILQISDGLKAKIGGQPMAEQVGSSASYLPNNLRSMTKIREQTAASGDKDIPKRLELMRKVI